MRDKFKKIAMPVLCLSMLTAGQVMAEDWTISAQGSCDTSLGNTVSSAGGIKASGGTAVVVCPLTKETVGNAFTNVWARMKRNSTSGASSFCYLVTANQYGTPNDYSYGYPSNTTNKQSVSIPVNSSLTQYYAGYADLYCVLVQNDTLFGVRYRQKN